MPTATSLHGCTQHAGARQGAHEHILTALQRLFTKAGYRTDRKNVPHSRGLKKADLWIQDFKLAGVWNVIVDVAAEPLRLATVTPSLGLAHAAACGHAATRAAAGSFVRGGDSGSS
jgi:hypothetical protein